jgi:hypothetical protein
MLTCNHCFSSAEPHEHVLDQSDVGTRLQVAHALAQDGDEHAPDLGLKHASGDKVSWIANFQRNQIYL